MNSSLPDFRLLWKQYKVVIIGLGFLGLLYLFLRVPNLTVLPIFADEAIYIRWAQVMRSEPSLRFLPMTDGKQPLFMWTMIPLLKLIDDPLVAGRLLSVFTGMGTMFGLFFLTLQLLRSQKHALLTAFLYSVVPYTVFFDRMALVDSMLAMWGVWGMLFTLKLVTKLRLDYSMLSGGLLGMAWLTKSPAIVFLGLVPASAVVHNFPKNKKQSRGVKSRWLTPRKWYVFRLVCYWLLIFLLAVGIYNILRLGPEFHQIGLRNKDYVYPANEVIDKFWNIFIPHLKEVYEFYWKLLTPGLFLAGLLGIIIGLRNYKKESVWLLIWVLVPIIGQSIWARNLTARYLLYVVPAVLIFSSVGLHWLLMRSKALVWRSLILLVIFVPVLWMDFWLLLNPAKADLPRIESHGYLEEWTAGHGLREVADYIKRQANAYSVVVGTEGFFGTMPDGLQIYFDKNPNVTIVGQHPIVERVSQQLYDSLDNNKVYLLVNSTRLKIEDPESAGLRLIKSFPKKQRPDGSREELLFFELIKDM